MSTRTLLVWGDKHCAVVAVESNVPGVPSSRLPLLRYPNVRKETLRRLLASAARHGIKHTRTEFRLDGAVDAGDTVLENEVLVKVFGRTIVRQINDENQAIRRARKAAKRDNPANTYPASTWSRNNITQLTPPTSQEWQAWAGDDWPLSDLEPDDWYPKPLYGYRS